MTQDIGEHLRKLTSRQGRYWLRDSRGRSADAVNDDLPFQSVGSHQNDRGSVHESVVVSIPNVAALNAKAAGIVDNAASQTATLQQRASQNRQRVESTPIHQVPPAPQPETIAKASQIQASLSPVVPAVNQMVGMAPSLATPALNNYSGLDVQEMPAVPPPVVDAPTPLPSKTVTPSVKVETVAKSDDAVEAARALQSKKSSDSIVKIADEVISKHPVAASSLIMVAGSQASMHADETCARVAAELASRKLGRVLLIDSDFIDRRLSKASGMSSQGGLSEIMNIALPWEKAILKSGSSKLDFMAAGSCPHKRWTPKETLREAIAEIRSEYQFVCVSVGDAHSSAAALWSELSDGAFLVVSAVHSSDSVAESAVERLRGKGARLNGCIVADVPSDQ